MNMGMICYCATLERLYQAKNRIIILEVGIFVLSCMNTGSLTTPGKKILRDMQLIMKLFLGHYSIVYLTRGTMKSYGRAITMIHRQICTRYYIRCYVLHASKRTLLGDPKQAPNHALTYALKTISSTLPSTLSGSTLMCRLSTALGCRD